MKDDTNEHLSHPIDKIGELSKQFGVLLNIISTRQFTWVIKDVNRKFEKAKRDNRV